MSTENTCRQGRGSVYCSKVAHTSVVQPTDEHVNSTASTAAETGETSAPASNNGVASNAKEITSDGMSDIRRSLKNENISDRAVSIIMQSWRPGTQKQYNTYLQKWRAFCESRSISTLQPTVAEALDFFVFLYESGSSYSAINSARSALSAVLPS